MRRYWNKIDELFHKAQEAYQDEAPNGSWERISGALDRSDAEKYRKKFIALKRVTIAIVLLFSTFAIYEMAYVHGGEKKKSLASIRTKSNNSFDKLKDPFDQMKNQSLHGVNTQSINKGDHSNRFDKKSEDHFTSVLAISNQSSIASSLVGREINIAPRSSTVLEEIKPALRMVPLNKSLREPIDNNLSENFVDPDMPVAAVSKWTLTAFFSNEWAGYRLDNEAPANFANSQNRNAEDERELINARERHESSYSAGMYLNRQLNAKWGLKSGLMFSQTSISILPQEIYATQTPDGSMAFKYVMSSGYVYVKPKRRRPIAVGDSIKSADAHHKLSTFTLPLMVSRYFTKGRFTLIPSAGVSLNYISSARFETELQTRRRRVYVLATKLEGMKDFYVGALADVDIRFAVRPRWSVSMLSSFRYSLTPITKENVVKTFPYSFTLGGALTYTF